jgi:hypothetical protein
VVLTIVGELTVELVSLIAALEDRVAALEGKPAAASKIG